MLEQSTLNRKHEEIVKEHHRQRRKDFFEQRRPLLRTSMLQPPNYLSRMDEQTRASIMESLTQPIPSPLPSLCTATISYYRRANQHVFLIEENSCTNPHLICESLWMLTLARPEDYADYKQIAALFQQQLPAYLSCGIAEIVEMATIVAGNHVLGKQEHIIQFSRSDDFWVFANHFIEGRLDPNFLFREVMQGNAKAVELLYQLSNSKGGHRERITTALLEEDHQTVLEYFIEGLEPDSPRLEDCLRILGTLLMESGAVDRLLGMGMLTRLEKLLRAKRRQVREEACWALSNIAAGTEMQATTLLRSTRLVARLLSLLQNDVPQVQLEVMHIFVGFIKNAAPREVFELLLSERTLLESVARLCQQRHSQLQVVITAFLEGLKTLAARQMNQEEAREYVRSLDRFGFGRLVDLELSSSTMNEQSSCI